MFFGCFPKLFNKKKTSEATPDNTPPSSPQTRDNVECSNSKKSTPRQSLRRRVHPQAPAGSGTPRLNSPQVVQSAKLASECQRIVKAKRLMALTPEDKERIFGMPFDVSDLPVVQKCKPCLEPYKQHGLHFQFRFDDASTSNLPDKTTTFRANETSFTELNGPKSVKNTSSSSMEDRTYPHRNMSFRRYTGMSIVVEEEDLPPSPTVSNIIV